MVQINGIKVKAVPKALWKALTTLGGVLIGIVLGLALRMSKEHWTMREIMYVKLVGQMFLKMLGCISVPLFIPSLVVAVGSLNISVSGRIGRRGLLYCISTTVIAVVIGVVLVNMLQPGLGGPYPVSIEGKLETRNLTVVDHILDFVRNLVPDNIVHGWMEKSVTVLKYPGPTLVNSTIQEMDKWSWNLEEKQSPGTNFVGMIVVSLVTGVAIAVVGEEAEPVLNLFSSAKSIMMKITKWIINVAPIGILFLVAGQILEVKDLGKSFESLGWYCTTVLLGFAIHGCVVLPLIYVIFTRSTPFRLLSNVTSVLAMAFGTTSSQATLPLTLEVLETSTNVDKRIVNFLLPIGATINMDGTALYEAVSAIFIAQVRGIDMTLGCYLGVIFSATAASIATVGVPQGGLVTMVMMLEALGLPASDVRLIIPIEWLLSRFRTVLNVFGDIIGAGIVFHFSKNEFPQMAAEGEPVEQEITSSANQISNFVEKDVIENELVP